MAERRSLGLLVVLGLLVIPLTASFAEAAHVPETWREGMAYETYDPDPADETTYADNSESQGALIGTEFFLTQGHETARFDLLTGDWNDHVSNPGPGAWFLDGTVGNTEGKLLMAGGRTCSPPACLVSNRTALYDPATEAWTELADLPERRTAAAGGVIDGKFYVAGGREGFNEFDPPSELLQIYDISTDTWTTGPPLPEARWGSLWMITPDQKLIVAGGVLEWGSSPELFEASTRVDIFDPETMTWSTLAPLPAPMWEGIMGECGGHYYAIGNVPSGFDRTLAFRTYRYDVTADNWALGTMLPEIPAERRLVTGVLDSPDLDVLVVASIDQLFVLNCQDDAVFPIPELPAGLLALVGLAGVAGLVAARRGRSKPPDGS